ncbi:eukaryotic translation initiation factor 3 subunit B [Eurytemora carolleeae]|uniref:eukaryotic translation initiation factor 3 subunit B n=1 Tax=Eurytemora carolleeae TaxID=1294199 RepID=UPI000C75B6BC|nr:eukaryotic translation initiation factor 3 subunit B [Eurytemora carolleeae]|eukprot:XP_023327407.1 eukaryotic translation initiation factor 3 subunit B-like [Eurytemora affinis]
MARKKNPEEFDDDEEIMDYGEEPDFNDPEGFVDDVTDEELMPDVLRQKPRESDGVDSVIVVDGVPVVGADRVDKLKNVIRKTFGKFGKLVNEHYPLDDEGQTKGYIFLEYSSPDNAEKAVAGMDNYKLDKQHTFLVNLFSDFEKYDKITEEWEEPTPKEYVDQGNLRSWLLEPDAADQFSVIHNGGSMVSIFTNNIPDPVEVSAREGWTESYVKWSPLGTYLTTIHTRGIALWGGDKFGQLQKFAHFGVEFIDFSPCEKYVVTFSPRGPPSEEPTAIVIWDTRTGAKKRAFHAEDPPMIPAFKWSHDDKFFARMSKDGTLSIYETPSFGLLDKKSIKVPGMQDFSWSPKENILAYWVAEDKDVPARVVLLEIPHRKEIRVKNLFNVADCKMHWQKCGDYLCVKVDRYKKILSVEKAGDNKYAGMYCNFEIFHMLEKQIPVDSVEVKESVHAFSWEPVGSKFAVIHGESQSFSVSFYKLKAGQTPILVKKYERKTANHIFWSPTGQFVILAGLRSMNGVLEFIDTSDFTTMGLGEHFMCTDVEWDPTGRYVVTGVSFWGHKVDNAYWIWNFQGKILKRAVIDKFCQLLWRPRPQTLLSEKQVKEIKKNLKKYSDQFNAKDKMRQSKASKELIDKRRAAMDKFREYREKHVIEYADTIEDRLALRNGVDTDNFDESELDEEVVEFLVKEEAILIQD